MSIAFPKAATFIDPFIQAQAQRTIPATNGRYKALMKRILTSIAVASLGLSVPALANAQAPIEGRWTNPKRNVVIDVDRCAGGTYCGKVVWASAKAKSKETIEGPLVGAQLMSGFRPDGKGGYRGQVIEPKRNMRGKATIRPAGPNAIVVKGCAVAGLICKEQRWIRAS
jgi:uncharacterized protein (DUF2147 family)